MRIKRLVSLAVAATVASTFLSAGPAGADDPIPIPSLIPTPTPTPTPGASGSPEPSSSPKPSPKPGGTSSPSPKPGTKPPSGPAPTPYDGEIADALAYWRGLPKTAARTTTRLLELLQMLQPGGAELTQQAIMSGVGNFPLAGYTWYQFDFAAPRYTPYFHLHEGTDLFAQSGTPVVACANGVIAKVANGSIGGVSIWLQADDGIVYYYGHLREWAPGIKPGARVTTGTLLGSVGNTGVAVGTYPHLHFEIHSSMGSPPLNPKPVLDAWLDRAEARAAALLRGVALASAAAATGAARWSAIMALLAEPAASRPSLWAAGLDPAAAGETFAALALERIAIEIDWAAITEEEIRREIREGESAARVAAALAASERWVAAAWSRALYSGFDPTARRA